MPTKDPSTPSEQAPSDSASSLGPVRRPVQPEPSRPVPSSRPRVPYRITTETVERGMETMEQVEEMRKCVTQRFGDWSLQELPRCDNDATILEENGDFYCNELQKQGGERSIQDLGNSPHKSSDEWAVLVANGYDSVHNLVRFIAPHKKQPPLKLSETEIQFSTELASDREIVEKFFGRLVMQWGVIGSKWRWQRSRYDSFVHLLRRAHQLSHHFQRYHQHVRRLHCIAAIDMQTKKENAGRYRQHRKRKLMDLFGDDDNTNNSDC